MSDLLTDLTRMKSLYTILMPNAPAPTGESLLHWHQYDFKYIERAMIRASQKFNSKTARDFENDAVARYITSIVRAECSKGEGGVR